MPISNFDSTRAQAEEAVGYRDGESIRQGVQAIGEKAAHGIFKRVGCFVPIVGGTIGVIQAINANSPEMVVLSCAGAIGLYVFAIRRLINRK